MADYHPLIARAVAGLDKNTGENRRVLYERARTALVAQLRGVTPALDESEITRERLALEEAIRKVEADAARQAREAARPTVIKRAETPPRPAPAPSTYTPSPRPQAPPVTPSAPRPSAPPPPSGGQPRTRRTLADEGMRSFHQGEPPPRRVESFDRNLPPAPSLPAPGAHEFDQLESQHQAENLWALPLDGSQQPPQPVDFDAAAGRSGEPPADDELPAPAPAPAKKPRSYSGLIRLALVLVLVVLVGSLIWWQRSTLASVGGAIMALVSSPSTPSQREAPATPSQPKITDRIGQPGSQATTGPAVAQRVVLYEEDPQDAQGKRYVGTVLWRTEMRPQASGRPPEIAVRADIEVAERNMNIAWSLRRNTDQSLPASHTIEIVFTMPADSPSGGVQNVPGVLMKQAEQTRGVPLAGLAVKVTPGFFLIGLSALETDMQRNLQLLKERGWFDIPIVYNNNRRAILAMEKGTPGEKAFADAFAAWRQ